MDNLRVMLRTYRSERRSVSVILPLLVAGAFFETIALLLLVPIATAVATGNDQIDRTIGGIEITASPSALVFLSMGCVVLGVGTRMLTAYLQGQTAIRVEARERARLYDAFLHAQWDTQSAEPPGRFQWATSLTTAYADLLGIIFNTFKYVINVAMMLAAAFLVSPSSALVITAIGVSIYVLLRPLLRASRNAQDRALGASQVQSEGVAEMVPLVGQIRAFGVTDAFLTRLNDAVAAVLKEKRIAMLLAAIVTPVYQAIGMLIALSILAYATTRQLDIPAIGAVALLLLRSISSAQGIQNHLHKYAEYRPVLDALEAWNARYAASREPDGTLDIEAVESIELVDVTFAYDSDRAALTSVSLRLLAGDDVGLVGPSGAGKSTLAQVLLRFRSPTQGRYLVNGIEARQITARSFSREVAYVPQAPLMLRGTVHDNITLYRPGIDRARVEEAARQAGVHNWIVDLPQGYDTIIGPDTHGFSGGQAQRLSIARALAGEPSMMVLDEPTSALDVDSEELVTDALRGLPEHVIVVLIAHRMSTLRHCNRVVVLEDGQMTASGSTAETLEGNLFFRRAVEAGAFSPGS